jgi:hypothetical protein
MPNPHMFRSIIGALQYVTITKPDIAFDVNRVSQFMHSSTLNHWATTKHILRYLKGSIEHGIQIRESTNLTLQAFFNSDWAGCPDDRKSTTGYLIFLGPNLISWSSRKQPIMARLITEAEYRSLAMAVAELVWLHSLLKELGYVCPIPVLWCDNLGATFLASNPVFHARTKHARIGLSLCKRESGRWKLMCTLYMFTRSVSRCANQIVVLYAFCST